MHTFKDAYIFSSKLYWVAFLLTGHKELSARVTIDALSSEYGLDCMSSPRLRALLRRTVIKSALAETQTELSRSLHQFASQRTDLGPITVMDKLADPPIGQAKLEEALLAIELFPRCALLLTVFERFPMQDAETLLHCNRNLIQAGQVRGLTDLARNLGSVSSTKLVPQAIRAQAATSISGS